MKTQYNKPNRIILNTVAALTAAGLAFTAQADDEPDQKPLTPAQTKAASQTDENKETDSKLPENKPFVQGLRGDKTLTPSQSKAKNRTTDTDSQEQTLQHITSEHVSTSKFHDLVEAADLGNFLKQKGKFTLFVPSDEAFEAIPQATLDHLTKKENVLELRALLKNHIAPGIVRSAQIEDDISLPNLANRNLNVGSAADKVVVDNRATVTTADLEATNGVIHIIDTVLTIPQKAVAKQIPIVPASE